MRKEVRSIKTWLSQHLTLRWRLALGSAALLSVVSLSLIIFVNVVARAIIPESIAVPLLSSPPPTRSIQEVQITPVPIVSANAESGDIVKGIAIRQVQQETLQEVTFISIVGTVLMIGLGSVGAYWLAGQTMRPVRRLVKVTRRIGARELDRRITLEGPQDEIKELAHEFNDMLARLEQAFDQQDRFVGDAAHELRTPLTSLRTNLEVLQANPNTTLAEYKELTQTLEKGLTRLERLVDGLLLLARDEVRNLGEGISLGPLLEEVTLELGSLADKCEVELKIAGNLGVCVKGDERLLMSAFYNLVENGIRYNKPGGEVLIRLRQEDPWAVIAVSDTGIGISEEEQAQIFDRFYRVDRSRSRHRGGFGLGLPIVAHIVDQHDGQIEVESQPGQGSTFTIRLPNAKN